MAYRRHTHSFRPTKPGAWPLKIPKSSLHFENGSAGCFFAWFAVYGLAVPITRHWSAELPSSWQRCKAASLAGVQREKKPPDGLSATYSFSVCSDCAKAMQPLFSRQAASSQVCPRGQRSSTTLRILRSPMVGDDDVSCHLLKMR